MITNPDWQKSKVKPYLHQISFGCIEKLVVCIGKFNKDEIDCDTLYKIQKQILINEIEDEEFPGFAIENFSELMGYIATGRINIRIHRDITGLPDKLFGGQYVVWGGVGIRSHLHTSVYEECRRMHNKASVIMLSIRHNVLSSYH